MLNLILESLWSQKLLNNSTQNNCVLDTLILLYTDITLIPNLIIIKITYPSTVQ